MALDAKVIHGFVQSCLQRKFDKPVATPQCHLEWWELCCSGDKQVAIAAPREHAKAQALTSKVLTPYGWKMIGELKIGDEVVGGSGKVVKVTNLHPIQEMELYEVSTTDNRKTLCNLGHLWNVTIPSNTGNRIVTKTLEELIPLYLGKRKNEHRVFIPTVQPIEFQEKEYILDPYTLGAWLGDGHSAGGRFTTNDPEILDYFPYPTEKQSGKYGYVIREIYPKLKELGVLNNKYIPEEYLYGSIEQRTALLQGLIDTDGSISTDGKQVCFTNKNKRIIEGITALIRSLGGCVNITDNYTTCNGKVFFSYRIIAKVPTSIQPCRLLRKVLKWKGSVSTKAGIKEIKLVGRTLGRCISVNGSTYITDDYLLTHNSTAITLSYVLAAVLFREHQFVIICSDTEGQSSLFLGDIKQELIENEDLIALFGVRKFIKLSETDIIVEMDDGYKFRIMAKGAEQKLRGTKWDNKRPDLIVCDDIENDEAVVNADRREKFRRWFYGALMPSRATGGKIIVVGTILHMDSLLERLMPVLSLKTTISEDLKDYSAAPNSIWEAVKYRAHNTDFSKILWKEKWSVETLKKLKRSFLEQGMADVYSREYLNYPIDESTAYFRRDDFLPLTPDDLEERVNYYSAIDFAISTAERADYTVIATVAVNPAGDLLVVDIRRGRWDANEIINEMFSVHKRYRPELFVVESGAIQKAIGPFLQREMQQRGTYINLHPVTPTKDKQSRARSLQARMRAGGIRYDKDKIWYPSLEDEMARFPRDRHDDQVDALSWIGLVLDKIIEVPTKEEYDDESYNQMVNEETTNNGRSKTTGY